MLLSFYEHFHLDDHKAKISTPLTFPRCASQLRDQGVDEVGAAVRWKNSAEKKEWSSGRRRKLLGQ